MLEISEPRAEDFDGVNKVLKLAWLATYPNIDFGISKEDVEEHFKGARTGNIQSRLQNFLSERPDRLYLVARIEDKVVGFSTFFHREGFNQLQSIYVHPDFHGKGIGQALWHRAEKFLDNDFPTIVHVAVYNSKAIWFYEKLGFKDTGKRFTDERFRMPISGVCIPEMEMIFNKKT